MIVLDTHVVSEAMKPAPDASVRAWLNGQVADTLYLTSITLAELLFGIAALPTGQRKQRLTTAFEGTLALFEDRVLPFDTPAARQYAGLAASARQQGSPLPVADGYIAAIAAATGFGVASRDTTPFEAAGISVTNPWEAS